MTSLLSIHSHRPTDVEFDVSIQGISESTPATVRFVVENHRGYDVSIMCEQVGDNKFRAKIPALDIDESEQPFRVEVIVDGYYFSPSRGNMRVARAPRVQMEQTSAPILPNKPQVTTTFAQPVEVKKKSWIKLSEMSDRQQNDLKSKCQRSAKILESAAVILATVSQSQAIPSTVGTQALGRLCETVRNACDVVESSIIRQI